MWQRLVLRNRRLNTLRRAVRGAQLDDAKADANFERRAARRRRLGSLMLLPSGPGRWMWDVALAATLLLVAMLAVLPFDQVRSSWRWRLS